MKKPEKAIAVAAGAVLRQGKILLIRRNFEPFIGCWGMPGGKIHLGEHVEEAVEREVREETGVRAEFERFCGVLSEKVRGIEGGDMHYLVLVSRLKGLTSRITESREGQVRWFRVRDLAELKDAMIPSDFLMLERFGILQEPISTQRHKGAKSEIRHSATRPLDHWATIQTYARCEIAKRSGRYRVVRFY
jgi:ADP-ribose pyrophosphatase YjhB (NUDIX family)